MADKKETTVIAPDTYIKGEMVFENSATIQGKFEGRIAAKGDLTVADSATCAAEVEAANIIVDGKVEGNLKASSSITLTSNAKLVGDLVTAKLITAEGASISGHVTVGATAKESPKQVQAQVQAAKPSQAQARQTSGSR